MIVADTQLLVYLTMPVPESPLAAAVLAIDAEWASPLLWRSEFRNALLGFLRAGRAALDDALMGFVKAAMVVDGREHAIDTSTLLHMSVGNRITAYDLEFVVLAQSLGVPLVTFDKEVLSAFPGVAVHPSDFVAASSEPPRS